MASLRGPPSSAGISRPSHAGRAGRERGSARSPSRRPGTVRAVTAGHPPPRPGSDLADQLVDAGGGVQPGRHFMILAGGHHIMDVLLFAPLTQLAVLPVRLVGGEPRER